MRPALPSLLLAAGFALSVAVLLAARVTAADPPKGRFGPAFEQEPFGKAADGSPVTRYTLVNRNGVVLKCIDQGGIVTELHVPDKDGKLADVVLGFDKLADYEKPNPYFGANVGRCANRVANSAFTLDGKEYKLAANNGTHSLHGGKVGFDKKVWKSEASMTAAGPGVTFTYTSKDGEEGYPGALSVTIGYTLTDANELVIEFRATTNKATVCNLAHHSYFNLAGHNSGDILGHEVKLAAANYTPVDETLIPTGKIAPVAGTPLDFTTAKPIGKDLKAVGGTPVGYDHNFVLDPATSGKPAATVTDPKSGRVLEVFTTEPGLQFYTGNFLDGTNVGKGGAVYKQHGAFCLEAQKFPDAIHKVGAEGWASPVLKPGETYKQTTTYKFGVAR